MEAKSVAGVSSPAKIAEKLRLAEALRDNLRRRKVARKRPDEGRAAEADTEPCRDKQTSVNSMREGY